MYLLFAIFTRCIRSLVSVFQSLLRKPSVVSGCVDRFAIVSHVVPPMWSGQAMVLDRLLSELPGTRCVVISSSPAPSIQHDGGTFVGLPREAFHASSFKRGWLATGVTLIRCCLRGFRIAAILSRERCAGAVACTGDLIDLPATAFACRVLGIRFIPYYFDDYVAQWSWAPAAMIRAKELEPFVFGVSTCVIVPNERLGDAVQLRSKKPVEIVRNPAWLKQIPRMPHNTRSERKACKIVYTGAVYHVNYDAFRCLIASMGELVDLQPELDIYSAQDQEQIQKEGIAGFNVKTFAHVAPEQVCEIHRQASVLFMGFTFGKSFGEIVCSSAPGKLGDYLASGVPVVALTPRDSFLADFLIGHDCGFVVDRPDPSVLADAIRIAVTNLGRREEVVKNALSCARQEFSAVTAVKAITQSLGLVH